MTQFVPFTEEPTTTHDQILTATYHALHQSGYAGLSIQRIADFTEITKSSIYYHFENKEELLLAFLEKLLQEVRRGFNFEPGGDPITDLDHFIDKIFVSINAKMEEDTLPIGAYIEIRSQAIWNESYQKQITNIDDAIKEQFQSILQRGIKMSVMKDIDVDQVGEFFVTLLTGLLERYVTTQNLNLDPLRAEIDHYLKQRVIA